MPDRTTPLRDTLARLHLSQMEAARLLGVEPRTVRRWCEPPDAPGHRCTPEPVCRLLDLIEHVPFVREYLVGRLSTLEETPPC